MGDFTWILNKRIFLKITTDFENRLFHNLRVKAYAFYVNLM